MALARTALAKERSDANKNKVKDVGNGLLHEVVKAGDVRTHAYFHVFMCIFNFFSFL